VTPLGLLARQIQAHAEVQAARRLQAAAAASPPGTR
jgi:hypothetical protein